MLRSSVERGRRRLDRKGAWHIEIHSNDPQGVERALQAYLTVYAQSWKNPEPCPDFMPGLVRTAAREGWLRLGVLWLQDQPLRGAGVAGAWGKGQYLQAGLREGAGAGTQGAKVLMDPLTRVLYAHTRTSLQSLPLDGPAVWSDETPAVHPLTELTGVPAQNEIAVFEEQYRRMVGGPGGFVRNTALEVDDALPRAWSQVGPEGWLMRSAAVLDASRSRILSVGPDFDTFVHTLTPTLVNFARWTIAGPRPLPRYHTSVAIDPVRDRLLVYGGYLTCSGGCDPEAPGTVHAVQLGGVESWISVPVAAGPKPAPRKHALLVHDANRDRMLMFGGSERIDDAFAMGDGLSDCWELALGGDSLRWRQLLPDGYGPPASTYPRGFYDPVSDRLIVHAGSPTTRELLFALVFPNATTSTPPATVPGRPLQLSVGPNPSRTGLTRMQLTLPSAGPVRLEVLDLAGRCVAAMDHAGTIGTQRIEWELPGRLPAGVYHVRARQGATTDTRRWVTLR